jgi:hypothetical protein
VTRLEDARAALLASGLKAREGVIREMIRRDLAQPGPQVPEPSDFAAAEIRVLCPRGHFIADVMVLVVDTWPGVTILPGPKPRPDNGLRYEVPQNWPGDIGELWSRVRVSCTQSKCSYRGSFKEGMLAAELAEAAVARHAEHRLTS